MTPKWTTILSGLAAYFLGSIPFGYIIVRLSSGSDVRNSGSGNIGATNVLRSTGKLGGLLTLLLDAAKGFLAVFLSGALTHQNHKVLALAAVSAVLGHIFPAYLEFKGGKGVATSVGVFLYLAPLPILVALLIFVSVVATWRFVSLGSIIASAFFPILYFLLDYRKDPSFWVLLASVTCCGLVIVKHKDNLRRLMSGTENKLTGLKK